MSLTNAELAILSLVVEQPRHGYEIETVLEERGMRNWTEIGFSSIYYVLGKLEKSGLVKKNLMDGSRGAARKVFRATELGYQALTEGVLSALSAPPGANASLLLGLANWPLVSSQDGVRALETYRKALLLRREEVSKRYNRSDSVPEFVTALFDYSLTMLDCEIGWLDEFILQMSNNHQGQE